MKDGPVSSQQGYRYEPVPFLGWRTHSQSHRRRMAKSRKNREWLKAHAHEYSLEEICQHTGWKDPTARMWLQRLQLHAKDSLPRIPKLHHKHPLYWIWSGMLGRCRNPNYIQWKDYGGRGIRVCDRWQDFEAFVADVGERPSDKHSLGRLDNDKGYEPGNVEWQTSTQQNRNRRGLRMVTIDGETKCFAEWADHFGMVSIQTAQRRLYNGLERVRSVGDPERRPSRMTKAGPAASLSSDPTAGSAFPTMDGDAHATRSAPSGAHRPLCVRPNAPAMKRDGNAGVKCLSRSVKSSGTGFDSRRGTVSMNGAALLHMEQLESPDQLEWQD